VVLVSAGVVVNEVVHVSADRVVSRAQLLAHGSETVLRVQQGLIGVLLTTLVTSGLAVCGGDQLSSLSDRLIADIVSP
jgi:hypothetical protein